DADGNFIWAKSMGGISTDWGNSITTDASSNVYVVGYYKYTVDFDPGTEVFNLTTNEFYDIFIQKLDGDGNFIWSESMGETDHDIGISITTDSFGNVYVTGDFQYTVDFDPSDAIFKLTSKGAYDVFIQKLSQVSITSVDEHITFNNVSIFPNPNQGLVNINFDEKREVSIKVLNVSGQLIYHNVNISNVIHQFELNANPGVYFIELSSQGEKQYYKLVKN
ncbi:MAG: T9SS type A sorting domain-containing protein, partial [Fulvivirga sp.]